MIIEEIDKRHLESKFALTEKKFDEYMNVFSSDLRYKQMNGKIINKAKLTKDVAFYFGRIKNFTSSYERKSYIIEENTFIEKVIQKTTVSLRVFIFFEKKWTVEREGIYRWSNTNGIWKIKEVEILQEKTY